MRREWLDIRTENKEDDFYIIDNKHYIVYFMYIDFIYVSALWIIIIL